MRQLNSDKSKSRFGELLDTVICKPVRAAYDYTSQKQARVDDLRRALDAGALDVVAGRSTTLNSREELHEFFERVLKENRATGDA